MGKERFYIFEDNISGNFGDVDKPLNNTEIVGCLNEQQATITAQKKGLDEYMDNIIALSKENEQLRQQQQRLSTDKRFTSKWLNFEDRVWIDNLTKEQYNEDDVVTLLNKQQAEIDYLKDMITAMKLDIKNAMQMVSRWHDE